MQSNTANSKVRISTSVALGLTGGLAILLNLWDGHVSGLDLSQIKLIIIGAIPAMTLFIDKQLRILHLESKKTKNEASFETGSDELIQELTETYQNNDLPDEVRDEAKDKLIAAYALKFAHKENKVKLYKHEADKASADIKKVDAEDIQDKQASPNLD